MERSFGGGGGKMDMTATCNPEKDAAKRYDNDLGFNTSFGTYKLSVIAERVFEISGMDSTKNVLEIGSGTGELAIRYAKICKEVTCTDINGYMVDIAKRKVEVLQIKNIKFAVADALKLPFKDSAFDIVIERNVQLVYHNRFLEDGTAQKVLEEMKRVSRDKVIIIHQSKNPLQHFRENRFSVHYFTGKELKRLLEALYLYDIKIMHVTHSTPLLFNILGEMKAKKLERSIKSMPFIKRMGGGIIACGSKVMDKT